jgi:Phosphopantetheine attachment site
LDQTDQVVNEIRAVAGVQDVRIERYKTRLGRHLLVAKYTAAGQPADALELRRRAASAQLPLGRPARYLCVACLDDPVILGNPRPPVRAVYRAPVTEVESTVVDIWAEVLHLEELGLDDDVYELGADSLSTVEAVVQLSAALAGTYRGALPFELAILGARTSAAIVEVAEGP